MSNENTPSLYSNMDFTNANNFGEIAKQVNSGNYLNTSAGSLLDNSQFNFNLGNLPTSGASSSGLFSKENLFGGTDKFGNKTGGWVSPALGLLESGLGFYLGSQQMGQAEDTLAESKRQFNTNYNAQKTLINDQLNWQHKARLASNPNYAGELAQI